MTLIIATTITTTKMIPAVPRLNIESEGGGGGEVWVVELTPRMRWWRWGDREMHVKTITTGAPKPVDIIPPPPSAQ